MLCWTRNITTFLPPKFYMNNTLPWLTTWDFISFILDENKLIIIIIYLQLDKQVQIIIPLYKRGDHQYLTSFSIQGDIKSIPGKVTVITFLSFIIMTVVFLPQCQLSLLSLFSRIKTNSRWFACQIIFLKAAQ